ncbi:hypothetical protein GWI33_004562 [Rhynchophorus ferrugineus]|uniref:Sm domain-containing protein n=1 Tax=Rhynchophorus ferrugineus TaxID=354439 RepID=A0A834ILD6_RHYFE|nr:hypothetical protein GWI33_004562 [Rhynchophorus ferrugineus]
MNIQFHETAPSKKEQFFYYNTLVGLVKTLESSFTTIDLRNDCRVCGKISKVDGYMNIEMENVNFYDLKGDKKALKSFYINARNIRNIRIPPEKDVLALFKHECTRTVKKPKQSKTHTFKVSRAMKRNAETIAEAYTIKEK